MSINERKTEDIVREHFKKYLDDIVIEEQSSDTPKIKKLLSAASKSGLGRGSPEFIIQYKINPDFLIIVECKADVRKHESKEHLEYKDFAVDGALLYSSYLSKAYDVLSVAVSGENTQELRVSHFLQLKGEKKAVEKFGNKLLSPSDYLQGYIKSPEKFRQDYDKLLLFSKDLNDKLHGYKILESDRSLLISCILIALENQAFSRSYKEYSKAEDLAKYLVDTVEMEFKNSGIQDQKLRTVKSRFEFIKTDTSLSTKEGVLKEIVADINDNINTFIQTHEYFDVLGQLYIEFLRYANSDKGLGIVLTPPHITNFMACLAEVNKDSVVYDSCAGTGGFLISAMNLMIKDAKGDQTKIKEIKRSQLIGVEYQANIFALACSNMFIHQDGKTNILNGSCFDQDIIDRVKEYKPTVGLLNPPYKSDKKKDIDELEFILNNLACLEQGGTTVAIIPMQAALAQTGKILELKKKLLEKHTLEAVLSMPDELFFNSKVGVVSCIMIFTAKRPHPSGKKTFFGYFKEDGFVKRKNKGRIDANGKWLEIRNSWMQAYMNRENIPGLSINRAVNSEDEWCAEAYMETDYSTLTNKDFEQTILNFTAYMVSNSQLEK
ncbi:MAG: N-6 DNA methylase [Patescibacteria group bacterium]